MCDKIAEKVVNSICDDIDKDMRNQFPPKQDMRLQFQQNSLPNELARQAAQCYTLPMPTRLDAIQSEGRRLRQRTERDCLQVCLEEITGIPYEDIPEFSLMGDKWYPAFRGWLYANKLSYIRMNMFPDVEGIFHLPSGFDNGFKYIATLKKPEREYAHAVVIEITEEGESYKVHDPKINSDYTLKDLILVEIIRKSSV